jgi:hypothetical protein
MSSPKKLSRSDGMKKRWGVKGARTLAFERRSVERYKVLRAKCDADTQLWTKYQKRFGGVHCHLERWHFIAMSKALASGKDNNRLVKIKGYRL